MDISQLLAQKITRRHADQTQLSPEDIYELLGNTRRLVVIEVLLERSGAVSFDTLVEEIVKREQQTTQHSEDIEALRKSVYASLHQTHLPQLADSHVITCDWKKREVTLTNRGRQLEQYLVPEFNQRHVLWGVVYLVVSTGTALLVIITAIGWLPLGIQSSVIFGVGIMLTLAIIQTTKGR